MRSSVEMFCRNGPDKQNRKKRGKCYTRSTVSCAVLTKYEIFNQKYGLIISNIGVKEIHLSNVQKLVARPTTTACWFK